MAEGSDRNVFDKFKGALDSLGKKMLFRSDLLADNKELVSQGNAILIEQRNLLQQLVDLKRQELDFMYEKAEDQERRDDLLVNPPSDDTNVPLPPPESDADVVRDEDSGGSFMSRIFGFLRNLALGTILFNILKGFVNELTDGFLDATASSLAGITAYLAGNNPFLSSILPFFKRLSTVLSRSLELPFRAISRSIDFFAGQIRRTGISFGRLGTFFKDLSNTARGYVNVITNVTRAFRAGFDGLPRMNLRALNGQFMAANRFFNMIKGIGGLVSRIGDGVGSIVNFFRNTANAISTGPIGKVFSSLSRLTGAGGMLRFLGRIAWPVTLIMGLVDGIREFMNTEGSFFERFTAGIGGFLGEVIGAPIDLVKNIVAWILNMFGFERAAEFLRNISIEGFIRDMVGDIGALVGNIFGDLTSSIRDLFDGEITFANIGRLFGSLMDAVLFPVNAAINFVQNIFGWGDPDEPFRLSSFISDTFHSVVDWFGDKFTWAGNLIGGAWNGLTSFISDKFNSIVDWFGERFSWNNIVTAWSDLSDFISDKFGAVIDWFGERFSWEAITTSWTNLTNFIQDRWIRIRAWFTDKFLFMSSGISNVWSGLTEFINGIWQNVREWWDNLFTWNGAENDEPGWFTNLILEAKDMVVDWFRQAFAFLPSLEDIQNALLNLLPDWVTGRGEERVEANIGNVYDLPMNTATLDAIDRLLQDMEMSLASENVSRGEFGETPLGPSQEMIDLRAYREMVASAVGLNRGGIVNAPRSGGIAVLHGEEAVIPLDSPRASRRIDSVLRGSRDMASAAILNNVAPVNVNNGGNVTNNNTTTVINRTTDTYRSLDPAML